jgi:hypothetical protein
LELDSDAGEPFLLEGIVERIRLGMVYFLFFLSGRGRARAVFVARMMVNLVERLSGNWNHGM